jgi:diadenosine tetraphosphate (Ap4A) HIT family hydrolase
MSWSGITKMHQTTTCKFCDCPAIKTTIPTRSGSKAECNTCIYEDKSCYAVLDPYQYSPGHALVILKSPCDDIADPNIPGNDLLDFIGAIQMIARHLKINASDEHGNAPERIYTCMLCDGQKHLHAHLIPRYPYTRDDELAYIAQFTSRDEACKIQEAIRTHEMGGFWYIAEREKTARLPSRDEADNLEKLALKLRLSTLA